MNLYPSWRTNLCFFALMIILVGGYFFRQTQMAARELQNHLQDHSEILAAVVEVNLRNTLLSQSALEETVAASLENSARFIHYLDLIEPFSSSELTAFAAESGFAGVKIISADSGNEVSGPGGWLTDSICRDSTGLERLEKEQLYLFSYLSGEEQGSDNRRDCVLVGISSLAVDNTLERISVERLLKMLRDFYDIAYVRFDKDAATQTIRRENILETVVSIGDKELIVALKTDRFGKRRKQMRKEFILFISFLILFGILSSWLLYRVQRQRLQQSQDFERKMARQHEDAALGRAAATITHELRNPLNAIGMGLQRLQIEAMNLDQDHSNLLQSMRSAVDRSNTIITRLKDSIHAFEINSESVNLLRLVKQVVTLYQTQCDEQKVAVELECGQDIFVHGDRVLLEQLFENLVKNSVEAQPTGGFLRILLDIPEEEKMCQLEIVNGGFLLNSKESKLLFEPYFTSKSKGTGLGLVISDKIVQAHKGALQWNADYEKETICFTVNLPIAQVDNSLL